MSQAARYPDELSRAVTTTDGMRVFVRAIRPEDAERLVAFHDRLGEHTIYQRFFTVMKHLPPDWARILANVDYGTRLALVAGAETPRRLSRTARPIGYGRGRLRGPGRLAKQGPRHAHVPRSPSGRSGPRVPPILRLRARHQSANARSHQPLLGSRGAQDRPGCSGGHVH